MKRRAFLTLLAVGITLQFLAPATSRATTYLNKAEVTVPNIVPNPNDLHITFTGTGGSIANVAVTPAGTTGVSGGGNTIDVTWVAQQAPGTKVVITFTTTSNPIGVSGGTWTKDGPTVGSVAAGDVTVNAVGAPATSPLGLMGLALAALAAGAFVISRRRAIA
jgi:hypothetical protein